MWGCVKLFTWWSFCLMYMLYLWVKCEYPLLCALLVNAPSFFLYIVCWLLCVSSSFSCQTCFVLIHLHPVASITQPPMLTGYLRSKMALQKRWDFDILEKRNNIVIKLLTFICRMKCLGKSFVNTFWGRGSIKQLGCSASLLWISPLSCYCCVHLSRTCFRKCEPSLFCTL